MSEEDELEHEDESNCVSKSRAMRAMAGVCRLPLEQDEQYVLEYLLAQFVINDVVGVPYSDIDEFFLSKLGYSCNLAPFSIAELGLVKDLTEDSGVDNGVDSSFKINVDVTFNWVRRLLVRASVDD